jgi:hypothetical protein
VARNDAPRAHIGQVTVVSHPAPNPPPKPASLRAVNAKFTIVRLHPGRW